MTDCSCVWTLRGPMKALEHEPSPTLYVTTIESRSPISFQNSDPAEAILLAMSLLLLCQVARSL